MSRLTIMICAALGMICCSAHAGDAPHEVHFKKIVLTDQFFSEGANVGDFNRDGKMDVVAGPFWYEGPDFTKRHVFWPGPVDALDAHKYSKNFFAFSDDINGDGWTDIIIIGFPGEQAAWYENPGAADSGAPWKEHVMLDHVDDESPTYTDLIGDGKRELVCIHDGQFGYATPDRSATDKPWTFHPISPKDKAYHKFTHGLGVGDVNGDGKLDLIEKEGWWEQPANLADGALWTKHAFHFADAASQMYAFDFNGDGRADIVSCLNAHGYGLAWNEQKDDGSFAQHLIMGKTPAENAQGVCFTEPHAVAIADMNGDGLPDIVTGKRHWAHGPEGDVEANAPSVLYWFEARKNASAPGGVEFVAHQIDDSSGVGTQVVVADINGDKKPDIVVGNKNGAFVFIQTDEPDSQSKANVDHFSENIRSTEPLSPEDERKAFHLPPGFEAQLVASEPDIYKPLNMQFDVRGRLWVTETTEYPFPATDRPGRDRIAILDIGRDGHATKITTFAEGLNIPIGIYPYKDGCIAHSIPEIRRYYDDNGDDHADRSEHLYGDIGHNDTHGMTNAFRRGFDGWLYANHGFNNISNITALDGSSITLNSGNTYRMRVDGSHIEQFTWGQTNPFGSCFDPLGNFYTSDSHSKPIYQLVRGGYYEGINKLDDGLGFGPPIMHHDHGSTAIAAAFYYAAQQFPKEWWGHMFVGNVVTSRINHDVLTYAGSSPTAHDSPDFLRSDDPWFRPNDMQLGPDGALYISDFYNRIIGHYEVPLNNPQRDHQRGRIWRIIYTGNPISPPPNLRELDVNGLIAKLNDPNLTVQRLAMDELSDRIGKDAIDPIKQEIADGKLTSAQKAYGLWVLYRLGALDESLIAAAMKDSDSFVRVHAMRMLSETKPWTDGEKAMVLAGLKDSDALVQRCAADALGTHPSADHVRPLIALLDATPKEDFELRYTVRVAIRNQLRDGDPQTFTQLDSMKLSDPELVDLLDITPAVATPGMPSLRFDTWM